MALIRAASWLIERSSGTASSTSSAHLTTASPEMKEMGDAVVKCALLVEEAVPLLRSISQEAARINAMTVQISQIEGRADDLHDFGVRALFERHSGDPMGFFTS